MRPISECVGCAACGMPGVLRALMRTGMNLVGDCEQVTTVEGQPEHGCRADKE